MAEYIDREAVREILYNHYSRDVYTHEGIVHKVTAEIDVDELNSIPAADVRENIKGKWELRGVTATCLGGHYDCSHCGARYDGEYYFCPNCGADMRKTCDDQERLNNERLDRE